MATPQQRSFRFLVSFPLTLCGVVAQSHGGSVEESWSLMLKYAWDKDIA